MKPKATMLENASLHQQPAAGSQPLPSHIAIIMDGNGRWAQGKGLPRTAGHKKGGETLKNIVRAAAEMGVGYLTVYAFSSENWKRPETEVRDLMELLTLYLKREINELHKNGIRIRFIGDRARLSRDILQLAENAEAQTAANTRFCLIIALSYGARQEMAYAARTLAERVKNGTLAPEAITEEALSAELYTAALPEPDLLIRTGGEQRLSNFLLWQSAYTELYFTPVLWPDFTAAHLHTAIEDFTRRDRRYGNAS